MRSGGHAPAREAAGVRRLHVEWRIADEHRRLAPGAQLLQDVRRKFRLRLQPGGVAGAEDPAQERTCAEVFADETGVGAALVREHGKLHAFGMLRAQQLERPGHQLHVFEEDRIGVRDMDLHRLGDELFRKEVAHRVVQAAPDGLPHLLERGRRPAEQGQRMDVSPVDRGKRVDDGAVEVQQDGVKTWHGRVEI